MSVYLLETFWRKRSIRRARSVRGSRHAGKLTNMSTMASWLNWCDEASMLSTTRAGSLRASLEQECRLSLLPRWTSLLTSSSSWKLMMRRQSDGSKKLMRKSMLRDIMMRWQREKQSRIFKSIRCMSKESNRCSRETILLKLMQITLKKWCLRRSHDCWTSGEMQWTQRMYQRELQRFC